jgi:hypothetical protein
MCTTFQTDVKSVACVDVSSMFLSRRKRRAARLLELLFSAELWEHRIETRKTIVFGLYTCSTKCEDTGFT